MDKFLNSDGFFEARRLFELCRRWKVSLGVRPGILKALTEKPVKANAPEQDRGLPLQPAGIAPKRLRYFSNSLWKELLDVYNNGSSNTVNVQGGTKTCRKLSQASRRPYITQ